MGFASAEHDEHDDTEPDLAPPSPSEGLQRAIDASVIQPKLTVGPADDPFEREADEVAAQVVAALKAGPPEPIGESAGGRVQRVAEVGRSGGALDASTDREIQAARGGGRPLDSATRSDMETAFGGADFGRVRLHTGGHSDDLNERISARAFTVGSDVFLHRSSVGDTETLAHELTHTIQQGGVRRSPAVVRREPTDAPVVKAVKRSDHTALLEAMVSTFVPDQIAKAKVTVANYIANGLGAGGVSKLRSKELQAFRDKMKTAARAQILDDINELLEDDGTFEDSDVIKSSATQNFLSDAASSAAHKPAKKSVDKLMRETATKWTDQHFNVDAVLAVASESGRNAAWEVLKANPTKKATQKSAQKAGQKAARTTVKFHMERYLTQARGFKNSIVKPDSATQEQNQEEMAAMAKQKVSDEEIGQKKLTQKIEAFSAGGALKILGKLLDNVIPLPGDSVALNITLTLPTGTPGLNYVIKLDGKAGRGITGFSTTGVTTLGEKKRLEIYASLQFGAGAEVLGIKGDLTVGIFTRAGSDKGTGATMTALTYAAYRGINDISQTAGAAWGLHDIGGSELSPGHRAEMWAAAVEANIFADEDDGTFGDVGAMAAASAEADLTLGGTGVEAALAGALELSKRFDTASLKDSLGGDFAKTPKTKDAASKRGKKAKGRTHTSKAISASAGVKILGQGVSFAAAFSTEHADGVDEDSGYMNWGVEISAGITMQNGSAMDLIAAGIVTGVSKCIHSVVAIAKTGGETKGPALDLLADAVKLKDAQMEGAISDALGKIAKSGGEDVIGVESGLTVAVTFGRAGGKAVFRVEIRESKSATVSIGVVSVQASKTTRLAAIGMEDGAAVIEFMGLRGGKNQ